MARLKATGILDLSDLEAPTTVLGWMNLYRTQWVLAHSALHQVVHRDMTEEERKAVFQRYLGDLAQSDELAKEPA